MLCCQSATRWGSSGQFAVSRSPMSSMKTGGVRLIGICSGLPAFFVIEARCVRCMPEGCDLSHEPINVRGVYGIEASQSLLDLRIRRAKYDCVGDLSNLP